MFEAMFLDLTTADKLQLGRSSTRMNYEKSGWRSLIKKSSRKFKKLEGPPYMDAMIKAEKRWGDIAFWQSLGAMKDELTFGYYLNAVDYRFDANKDIEAQPENRRVYLLLWWRTFLVSIIVTGNVVGGTVTLLTLAGDASKFTLCPTTLPNSRNISSNSTARATPCCSPTSGMRAARGCSNPLATTRWRPRVLAMREPWGAKTAASRAMAC